LAGEKWKEGEEYLSKSIHLLPKNAGNYINRALARYNQNNLRGAMADYDTALDLEPNNFLGHYNRGLLRAQVGDDNRGIEDFDFVLKLEPDNLMALFNRALLLEQTGNLRAAIRDYSKVIEEYPNFWFGLQHRASCYRRLGNTRQAELDEFRILKAQMDKRYGKQPRLSKKQMRKRSDEDLEKYNQLVVADEQNVEPEYKSEYRGRVQNRKAELSFQPMFGLTFTRPENSVRQDRPYEDTVEAFNQQSKARTVYVSCDQTKLDEYRMKQTFAYIDSLSTAIDASKRTVDVKPLLFLRAIAYCSIQNFDNAIDDLGIYLQIDSVSSLAHWQRAVCQAKINEFNASQGTNTDLQSANVLGDLSDAIQLSPKNAYLYYNRGNLYALRRDYQRAIDDFTRAIALEQDFAEAYYNRGLARIYAKKISEGIDDLSKAGELGLYQAYSVIKKYTGK
jgi:tetratricopeptide (TPR) repeat protein